MPIVAKLDELGRPAWIALMILGFIVWWPIGLAMLAFIIGSGRMSCWNHHAMDHWQRKMERMQAKMDRMRAWMGPSGGGAGWGGDRWGYPRSSGNHAFDEYRAETSSTSSWQSAATARLRRTPRPSSRLTPETIRDRPDWQDHRQRMRVVLFLVIFSLCTSRPPRSMLHAAVAATQAFPLMRAAVPVGVEPSRL
jgi:hypothetical protein